jgi:multicomponent Na+:H+ antiporter subunit G
LSAGDVISAVFILCGSVLALGAAVGLLRFDDVYQRMHAATKTATLAIALCFIAAAIQVDDAGSRTKLILAAFLQLLTAPVSSHLLARSAHQAGAEKSPDTVIDELEHS